MLEAGMTLALEPAIYLPQWGGVRIEDLYLVTPNGMELLSNANREPIIPV